MELLILRQGLSFVINQILGKIRDMPPPANYYAGVNSMLATPVREVLLFCRNRPFYHSRHVHHRCVLIICVSGAGDVVLDDSLFMLTPGEGIMVFPHQSHYYTRFEGENIAWLFITFEMDDTDSLLPLRMAPFSLTEKSWARVDRIIDSYQASLVGQWSTAGEIGHWLCLLLGLLLRQKEEQPSPRCKAAREDAVDEYSRQRELVRRVTQYVYQNIGQPLPLAEVARHVSVSASHLRRLFRQTLGISLGEYILQTRIRRACGLLHHSALNVSEVAAACGFSSLFAFSRAFRRKVGYAPLEYRKSVRTQSVHDAG